MKLYDLVKKLMVESSLYRNSDRHLMWKVWRLEGAVGEYNNTLTLEGFLKGSPPESIRRCRQKIQEHFPELRSAKKVQQMKDEIEAQKGTHVYREEVQS